MTLTARAIKILREKGCIAQVVERWIPQAKKRVDLFGCIDIVVVGPGRQVTGLQVTSASNFSSRRAKILASEGARLWAEGGGAIVLWGFRKQKNGRWDPIPRQEVFGPEAFRGE